MITPLKHLTRQLLPASLLLSSVFLSGCSLLLPQQQGSDSCTAPEIVDLPAEDIQLIEKDGRRYVRFVLIDPARGERVQQELRLRRRVLIKQSYGPDERRYVVRMWLTLGNTRSRVDVNLSDRTNFQYPLLIGRNFLTDSLIVDVSRHHTIIN